MTDDKPTGMVYVGVTSAMQALARRLQNITHEEVPAAVDFFRQIRKMADGVSDNLTERAKLYLNVHGKQATEKGTLEAQVGGYLVRAIPTRTGLDSKKVEKLLRARNIDVVAGMDPETKWKVNSDKIQRMVGAGLLTESDVAALRYDSDYRVEVKRQDGPQNMTIDSEVTQ